MDVGLSPPLISIIITCYNQGNYLPKAIESVLAQSYTIVEIILVDDGSTDNTKAVSEQYSCVKYIYQSNMGVSAARNTGIDHSSGDYILFLDADDWLLPNGLSANHKLLENHPKAAFVSGAFKIFKVATGEKIDMQVLVSEKHFNRLLEFNYISMIAAVLFRRWVFDEFRFDTSLKGCEDYDFYLKVARKYSVLHHGEFIAVYRFHDTNTSYNTVMMLAAAIQSLKNQEPDLENEDERNSFKRGIKNWKLHFSKMIYAKYQLSENKDNTNRKKEMQLLWINSKSLYFRFFLKKLLHVIQNFYKKGYSRFRFTGIA